MKKVLMMLLVALIVSATFACAKQSTATVTISTPALNSETEIVIDQVALKEFQEKWPVLSSTKQARALGLHEAVLTESVEVFNLQNKEKENPWKLESLPIGTKVWVDSNDIPRYKADCLNPIFCPTTTITKVTLVAPAVVTPLAPVVKKSSFWGVVWDILKWILIVLGVLLLLWALLRALPRIARWVCGRSNHDTTTIATIPVTSTPTPTPAPAPRLRVTPASAPIAPAAPARPSRPAVPRTTTNVWAINASLDKDGKIHIEGEGVDRSVAVDFPPDPDKRISITTFRR